MNYILEAVYIRRLDWYSTSKKSQNVIMSFIPVGLSINISHVKYLENLDNKNVAQESTMVCIVLLFTQQCPV